MDSTFNIDPDDSGGLLLKYKYRPLGLPEQKEHVRDILLNHRLYAGSPRLMNDPFECRVRWSSEATEQQKLARAITLIQKENPAISQSDARKQAPERCRLLEQHGPTQLEELIVNKLGFVSFGGSRDNLLMWAHYAGEHTGIAIEFTMTQPSHVGFFGDAHRVKYNRELPVINLYTDDKIYRARAFLLTKSVHWAYERESRIIVKNRNNSPFYDFSPEIITAVYLGCRVTDKDRKFVLECMQDRSVSVPLFQARQSTSGYSLEFDKF